jgi:hypothetical protein
VSALGLGWIAAATVAFAQTAPPGAGKWRPEASIGLGVGHVFRFEDETFGDAPALTLGLALRHANGLALEVEVSRPMGLVPSPAPCAVYSGGVPLPCVGTGRNGVLALQSVSIGGRYRFGRSRIGPYLAGAFGLMRTRSVWSVAQVEGSSVVLSESARRDTGVGPDIGAGLDIRLGRRLSLRPEARWLEASGISPLNLSITRLTVRTAYTW